MKKLRNYYMCDCAAVWSSEADHSCCDKCPECDREVECYDSIALAFDVTLIVSGAPGSATVASFHNALEADERFSALVGDAWAQHFPNTPFPPLVSLAVDQLRQSGRFTGLLEKTDARIPYGSTDVTHQINSLRHPVWFALDPIAVSYHKADNTRAAADNGTVQVRSFRDEEAFRDHLADLAKHGQSFTFLSPEFNV